MVTLGIIGVVAALTLPVLVGNYKKHVVETKLKSFYSTINRALVMSEIDNGPKDSWTIPNNSYTSGIFFDEYLKNYITYLSYKTIVIGGGLWTYVFLPDGTAFRMNFQGSVYGTFDFCIEAKYCNVNDPAKLYGAKVFSFTFAPNSPHWQYDDLAGKGLECFHGFGIVPSYEVSKNYCYNGDNVLNKRYCTTVIGKNNWKIPKDYPYIK